MRTAEEAVERAYQYTGFEEIKSVPQTAAAEMASLTVIENDSTPWLRRRIDNQNVWQVTFHDVVIDYEGLPKDSLRKYSRDFLVYIEQTTGKLLKIKAESIVSPWPYEHPAPPEEIESTYAGRMKFVDLPDSLYVPFSEILRKCYATPYLAAELEALYVVQSDERYEEPVIRWYVTLRGTTPSEPFGPDKDAVPIEQRTSLTICFDGKTGQRLGSVLPPPW